MQTIKNKCVQRLSLLLAIVYGGSLIGCSTYPQPLNRPTTYDDAIKHADTIVLDFQKDIWWGDFFRKTAGSGIIMMAGAALGLGISGTGGDALKILGFGGATALGVAGYLDAKQSDPVKWAGIIAIQCVVAKANQAVGSSQAFNRYYESLSTEAAAFSQATNRLAGYLDWYTGDKNGRAWKALDLLRQDSNATVTLSRSLLGTAHPPAAELFEIGNLVFDAAEGIRARVNSIVSKSDPDLGKLQAAISNLSVYRKQVTGDFQLKEARNFLDSLSLVQAKLSGLTAIKDKSIMGTTNGSGSERNNEVIQNEKEIQLIKDTSPWVTAIADRAAQINNSMMILTNYRITNSENRQISLGPSNIKTCIDGLDKDVKLPQIVVAPESPVIVKAMPTTGNAEPTNIFVSGIQGTMTLTPGVADKIKIEQSDAVGSTKLVKLTALVKEDAQLPLAITDDSGVDKLITVQIKK